ncbi:MAG: undecaprenyl/decaprenyl-phosphate alpha-N-acetylglucosaminyl 1-phosphate transferase [Planctomycetales bacterium]|nr:undecaprenyl/decaprenyl-phosphate alpha-N-acetylglucosaminyl 1-phosphate transferase [Planctomycetales bacterium]
MAYGGGVVILLAALLAGLAVFPQLSAHIGFGKHTVRAMGFLVLAAGTIVAVGVADDRFGMRGRHKLLFQFLVAVLAVYSGLTIDNLDFFGTDLHLGVFAGILTVMWILGAINSFNLIDGVDGLASTVGLVISLALGTLSLMHGDVVDATVAFAVAGAILGFLPYNSAPASMYLGDAGSMLIGLVLGVTALKCALKEATTVAAAPLVAIWAILILDSCAALLRRVLTGRSIYAGDRGHIHHRFLMRGFTPWQTMLSIGGLCLVTSLAAIGTVWFQVDYVGIVVALSVVVILAATRLFGHVEFSLLGRQLYQFGRGALRPLRRAVPSNTTGLHLQGTARWNELWTAILESTERFQLVQVRLNVHLARVHEDFYAAWKTEKEFETEETWQIDRPFMLHGSVAARLQVRGRISESDGGRMMSEFLEFAETLAPQISEIAEFGKTSETTEDVKGGVLLNMEEERSRRKAVKSAV